MSLANQLLASKPNPFPSFPSPEGFFSDLKSFADSNFSNFRSVEVFKGLTIYAGVTEDDEITTDVYVKELNGIYYTDKNRNDHYDRDSDLKLADVRVFISSDGVFLLKKYNSLKGKLKDDEVALFLEYSGTDIVSNNVTLVLATEKTKDYVAGILQTDYIQDEYFIGPKRQEIILDTIINKSVSSLDAVLDMIIQLQDEIIEKVTEIGISIFEGIETFFTETLRIPDSFWNADEPDYVVGKVGDLIEDQLKSVSTKLNDLLSKYGSVLPKELEYTLLSIEKLADLALEIFKVARLFGEFFIALVCGVWNGLMDTIGGIFGLVKLVIQAIRGVAKVVNGVVNYTSKANYYNALVVEYLDNMLAEAIKIDWKEVIQSAIKEMTEIAIIMIRIPELLIKKITEINHTEVGYYVGYILFEIVTWLFPPIKIAEISKLTKLTKFDEIRKVSKILPDAQVSKGSNYVDEFFEFIGPFIKELKKGTKSIKEFILNIIRKFKNWLKKVFGIDSKIGTKNFNEFKKKYGKLIERGSPGIRSNFDRKISKLLKDLEKPAYKAIANEHYSAYLKNPRIKNKLDKLAYLVKHKILAKNKQLGKVAEEVIEKYLKGGRPKSVKTNLSRRYPDNFYKGILREIKSGDLTMKYKKQILKDLFILEEKTILSGSLVKNIEWHIFGEVDELVLIFVEQELKQRGLPVDSFTIIIH